MKVFQLAARSDHPRIDVYRSDDGMRYEFMDMALVYPGHYVAWGELRTMSRGEASQDALDCVLNSLREFGNRDGRDKSRRLKLPGREPLHFHRDLVAIKALSPTSLELMPYRRGQVQHERLVHERLLISMPLSPPKFFDKLEEAFSKGAGPAPMKS